MSGFHEYHVRRDHNRHHVIVAAFERKYTYFIPMEADIVTVRQMENAEFAQLYEVCDYPVRRAAEIYLHSPSKEVAPKAREHLEAILADPRYAYDESKFSVPQVYKEYEMARSLASKVAKATKKVADPKVKAGAEAVAAQEAKNGPIAQKDPGTKAAAKKTAAPAEGHTHRRATDPQPRGRAPTVSNEARLKVAKPDAAKRGFMKAIVDKAVELEKAGRGKGFTVQALIDAGTALPEAEGKDASWVRTYVTYGLDQRRGIFATA